MGRKAKQAPDNVIFVSNGRGYSYRQINTKSKFFFDCEYFIIQEDDDTICFERAPLDAVNNIKKAVRYQGDWTKFQFTSNVPIGQYVIDSEDSNEDRLVVYFKEQLEGKL